MNLMLVHIHGSEELQAEARRFLEQLKPGEGGATVVTLSGELGAGKTTFAQGVAAALGVEETVASPTYVIEKIYRLEHQKWQRLVHIDAYRLKSAHELEVLGWKELLADSGNLIFLEWPGHVLSAIPHDAIRIKFYIAGNGREISF